MAARSKKRWNELSNGQRTAVAGAIAVQLGLHAAALADLRRRPRAELTAGKPVWAAVTFVNFLGPLAYFAFGRRRA